MRIALDSNILAYLAGVCRVPDDEPKIENVRQIIASLAEKANLFAPAQALGELFVVMRRAGSSGDEARQLIAEFADSFAISPSERATVLAAADLAADHRLQFWDALILSAAADAGCSMLLSEDMQHSFVTRGVTVVNPLAAKPHPRFKRLLEAG